MDWVSILLLAMAVSFDSLAIGMTYGLAKITIPLGPRLIISLISGLALLLAMLIGSWFATFFSPYHADIFGGVILLMLGLYSLWRGLQHSSSSKHLIADSTPKDKPKMAVSKTQRQLNLVYDFRIPYVGLVIHVFREPLAADYDGSKRISPIEAAILGFALALDAFAAGIGAAILRFPPLILTGAVIVASFAFVSKGLRTGASINKTRGNLSVQWIPGLIIILIAMLKFVV